MTTVRTLALHFLYNFLALLRALSTTGNTFIKKKVSKKVTFEAGTVFANTSNKVPLLPTPLGARPLAAASSSGATCAAATSDAPDEYGWVWKKPRGRPRNHLKWNGWWNKHYSKEEQPYYKYVSLDTESIHPSICKKVDEVD